MFTNTYANATKTHSSSTHLTKIILVALALTVTVGGVAFADGGQRGDRAEQRFERIDADENGAVTLTEFSQPMLERFSEVDADGDGQVSVEELVTAFEGRRAERRADRMIQRFDINSDGQVSLEEVQNRQAKMFTLLDFDDSGSLTIEEMQERKASLRGGSHGGGDRNRK